ncbi:hypothetical protein [Actinomyces marmotae]|uniref:Transcriptional regulator, AbiEi antitoxin, Type IV TA system n=1 Tax=Actinomyces marmotae TaxID=2737173 RepID=A0A6M8B213_9ACTO|nr:hypothetical protein [Actinomyces marmotae]QKD80378.1 hypothetical protein HPC72_09300 [Actinomyces marmotae]
MNAAQPGPARLTSPPAPVIVITKETATLDNGPRHPERIDGLIRIASGIYTEAASWGTMAPRERHEVLIEAVRRIEQGTILIGASAAIAYGLPIVGMRLGRVEALRVSGQRSATTLLHRRHREGLTGISENQGLLLSSVADTVIDIARWGGLIPGVCAMDAALHEELCVWEEIQEALERLPAGSRGVRTARTALGLADKRSESPGESVSRVRQWQGRLPRPVLQYVLDVGGRVIRVDFFWAQINLVGEYDGRIKYDAASFGKDPRAVLLDEKDRQNDLEDLYGVKVRRWRWADAWYHDGAAMIERLVRAGLEQMPAPWPLRA